MSRESLNVILGNSLGSRLKERIRGGLWGLCPGKVIHSQKLQPCNSRGFIIIELMIAVVIIGLLAAIAIPSYQAYIRRTYVSEAQSAIANIKAAQESYFSINREYISTQTNPNGLTPTTQVPWVEGRFGWRQDGLGIQVAPLVRFQYKVWGTTTAPGAGPMCGMGGGCAPSPTSVLITDFQGASSCFENSVGAGGVFVDTSYSETPEDRFYVVGARGNLRTGTPQWTSLFSAVADSRIFECNVGD